MLTRIKRIGFWGAIVICVICILHLLYLAWFVYRDRSRLRNTVDPREDALILSQIFPEEFVGQMRVRRVSDQALGWGRCGSAQYVVQSGIDPRKFLTPELGWQRCPKRIGNLPPLVSDALQTEFAWQANEHYEKHVPRAWFSGRHSAEIALDAVAIVDTTSSSPELMSVAIIETGRAGVVEPPVKIEHVESIPAARE
jgi:hypothetical protein